MHYAYFIYDGVLELTTKNNFSGLELKINELMALDKAVERNVKAINFSENILKEFQFKKLNGKILEEHLETKKHLTIKQLTINEILGLENLVFDIPSTFNAVVKSNKLILFKIELSQLKVIFNNSNYNGKYISYNYSKKKIANIIHRLIDIKRGFIDIYKMKYIESKNITFEKAKAFEKVKLNEVNNIVYNDSVYYSIDQKQKEINLGISSKKLFFSFNCKEKNLESSNSKKDSNLSMDSQEKNSSFINDKISKKNPLTYLNKLNLSGIYNDNNYQNENLNNRKKFISLSIVPNKYENILFKNNEKKLNDYHITKNIKIGKEFSARYRNKRINLLNLIKIKSDSNKKKTINNDNIQSKDQLVSEYYEQNSKIGRDLISNNNNYINIKKICCETAIDLLKFDTLQMEKNKTLSQANSNFTSGGSIFRNISYTKDLKKKFEKKKNLLSAQNLVNDRQMIEFSNSLNLSHLGRLKSQNKNHSTIDYKLEKLSYETNIIEIGLNYPFEVLGSFHNKKKGF
jgi:hypothetical protein